MRCATGRRRKASGSPAARAEDFSSTLADGAPDHDPSLGGRLEAGLSRRFDAALQVAGPFECAPRLAVAVSGGADSLALCLLAHDWARARGGSVAALNVDHGLRAESATEAQQVAAWLTGLGIRCALLRWSESKPASGIQAAARLARYHLLIGWCREHGVLRLLLGHHAGDQAETVLHRLLRGSGIAGLAGMAPLVQTRDVQLLRPLLAEEPALLRRFLVARGQPWIEDPANRDPKYARSRLRAVLPGLQAAGQTGPQAAGLTGPQAAGLTGPQAAGVSTASLGRAAARMAEARAAMDAAVAELVARCCRVHPAGSARIARGPLASAATEVAVHALARVVTAVGGSAREYDREPVRRMLLSLRRQAALTTTLGGCRLQAEDGALFVCREVRGLPAPVSIAAGERLLWDGRFRIAVDPDAKAEAPASLVLRALMPADGRRLRVAAADGWRALPPAMRLTLPVVEDATGLLAVPQMGWQRSETLQSVVVRAQWSPRIPITGPGYFLA